jgi:hypothetical protein
MIHLKEYEVIFTAQLLVRELDALGLQTALLQAVRHLGSNMLIGDISFKIKEIVHQHKTN